MDFAESPERYAIKTLNVNRKLYGKCYDLQYKNYNLTLDACSITLHTCDITHGPGCGLLAKDSSWSHKVSGSSPAMNHC